MSTINTASSEEAAIARRIASQIGETVLNRQFFSFWTTDSWRPSVNLYETRTAFLVCADIAGMNKSDISVWVEKNQLILRGKRECPMPTGQHHTIAVHLMEIDHGVFGRSVEIPANVDDQNISAHYEGGMLWVTLPKRG